jgi:hypothetical protein
LKKELSSSSKIWNIHPSKKTEKIKIKTIIYNL